MREKEKKRERWNEREIKKGGREKERKEGERWNERERKKGDRDGKRG